MCVAPAYLAPPARPAPAPLPSVACADTGRPRASTMLERAWNESPAAETGRARTDERTSAPAPVRSVPAASVSSAVVGVGTAARPRDALSDRWCACAPSPRDVAPALRLRLRL